MELDPENTCFLSGEQKPQQIEEKDWKEIIEDWWKGYKLRALLAYYGALSNINQEAGAEKKRKEMDEGPPSKRQRRV